MADVFLEHGYETGMFGKWHLGDNYPYRPQDRGFSHVVMHGGGGVGQSPDFWGNDYFNDVYQVNGKYQSFTGYCTDIWFDESKRFMKQSKEANKPFFAYVSLNAPHAPRRAPEQYVALYKDHPQLTGKNEKLTGTTTVTVRLGQESWAAAPSTWTAAVNPAPASAAARSVIFLM